MCCSRRGLFSEARRLAKVPGCAATPASCTERRRSGPLNRHGSDGSDGDGGHRNPARQRSKCGDSWPLWKQLGGLGRKTPHGPQGHDEQFLPCLTTSQREPTIVEPLVSHSLLLCLTTSISYLEQRSARNYGPSHHARTTGHPCLKTNANRSRLRSFDHLEMR